MSQVQNELGVMMSLTLLATGTQSRATGLYPEAWGTRDALMWAT